MADDIKVVATYYRSAKVKRIAALHGISPFYTEITAATKTLHYAAFA